MNVDQLGVGRDIDGVGTDIRDGEGIEGIGTGLGVQRGRTLPGRVKQADGAVEAVVDGLGLGPSEPQEARPPTNMTPAATNTGKVTRNRRQVGSVFIPHLRLYIRFST